MLGKLIIGLAAVFVLNTTAVAADVTVFGMELGKPLTLPVCPSENIRGLVFESWPKENACTTTKPESKFGYDSTVRTIRFPENEIPVFVKGHEIIPFEISGLLEGIEFFTFGIRDQEAVVAALNKKYGKPTAYKKGKVQNRAGASFESVTAEWKKPGVWVALDGTYGDLDMGRVTIDTDTGHTARQDWFKKRFGHKREL